MKNDLQITSRFKLLPILGKSFLSLLGLGIGAFEMLAIYKLFVDFNMIGLAVVCMLLMFTAMAFYVGVCSIKQTKIDTSLSAVTFVYSGVYKKSLNVADVRAVKQGQFSNLSGTYLYLLIECKNGTQFTISEAEYVNYEKLAEAILDVCNIDQSIEVNYFTKTALIMYALMALTLLLFVLSEFVK